MRLAKDLECKQDLLKLLRNLFKYSKYFIYLIMHTLPGIGIFGTNEVVKVLVPILREKGFEVQAIWGKQNEAEQIANELKINFFTNKIDDVLLCKSVDLIFILCQPFLHQQISVKALGIGKHVLCERPCGISVSDAQKMKRASEYYPSLIALVNHSLRFLPAFVHMKKALNENLIGSISVIDVTIKFSSLLHESYDWLCSAEMGGGVVSLIGSHVIDLIHFLTGKKASRVHAIVRTFKQQTDAITGIRNITAPDFCNFQMELEGGNILVVANLQSNQCCRSVFEQDVTIVGQDGKLVVAGTGDLICLKRKGNDVSGEFKEEKLYVEIQDMRTESSTSLPRPFIKGMVKMVGALKEAFATSTGWKKEAVSSAASFHDALYVQAVLEAITKSSESRTWIKIDMQEIQN